MHRPTAAATYRRLARGAEKIEQEAMLQPADKRAAFGHCFTCNAVSKALGWDAERAYRAAYDTQSNEHDLWRQPDCPSIRVLMLCFAAAMAETGDLDPQ